MEPEYFSDTDTLYLDVSSAEANGGEMDASEMADPEDFTFLLDESGRVVGIRIEHASHRVHLGDLATDLRLAADAKTSTTLYTLDELTKLFGVSKAALNRTLHRMRDAGISTGQRINPDHDNSPIFLTKPEVEKIHQWRQAHQPGRPHAIESAS